MQAHRKKIAFPMFASAPASRIASGANALAYRTVGVETGVAAASPHQLVTMLFDGFNAAIAEARDRRSPRARSRPSARRIGRAVRIVDEGLKAPLDAAGGSLSEKLSSLYGYVSLRLTQANLTQRRRGARRVREAARAGALRLGRDRPGRRRRHRIDAPPPIPTEPA